MNGCCMGEAMGNDHDDDCWWIAQQQADAARRLHVVVRVDGTVDLVDQQPDQLAFMTFGVQWSTMHLTVDEEDVGRVLVDNSRAWPENQLARALLLELTGAHFRFHGTVILADLRPGRAHLLLELARDTENGERA